MTTTFDDRLREELSAEDEAFLKDLEEDRGLFTQTGATFHGPMGFWTAFAFVISLIFFGLTIYCFVRLLGAETASQSAPWMAGFIWSSLAVAMIKLWVWLRMNHLATLRELKKLELRLVRLAEGS